MIQIECAKCATYFRTTGAEPLLCPACRESATHQKMRCIGCGRTEDEIHAPDCPHISGLANS